MSDQQTLILKALSQDLYRIAIGRHRGQHTMAQRFTLEAKLRISELTQFEFKDEILTSLDSGEERSAEDLLMYSTLVRNRCL